MKVKMTADSKRIVTLEDAKMVNKLISEMKEDESTAADYAVSAVNAATGGRCDKVYEATAEICKNSRIWNQYSDESKDFDIWISATARTYDGFVEIGACLSDIWSITGDNEKEIAANMYVRNFSECK